MVSRANRRIWYIKDGLCCLYVQCRSLELCSNRTQTLCSRGPDGSEHSVLVDYSRLAPLHGYTDVTDKLFGHLGAQADVDDLACCRRRYHLAAICIQFGRPCLWQAALGWESYDRYADYTCAASLSCVCLCTFRKVLLLLIRLTSSAASRPNVVCASGRLVVDCFF